MAWKILPLVAKLGLDGHGKGPKPISWTSMNAGIEVM